MLQFPLRDLPRGSEDAECDGQIEASAVLGQVGGREVDGDPAQGKFEIVVQDGAANAFLALAHRGFRQTDD
ncbi:hypothetical protein D3C83_105160 [compost metagenome]